MARPRRRLALACAAAFLVPALAIGTLAAAQGLRKLHVDALAMRADRTQVRVGEVFHLAIHARVREPVSALDELVVPDVGTMQLEGDERHVSSTPAGTDVVETLTLEPTQSGTFVFKGAYLDAIDARSGKPSRFSANSVRVVVASADRGAGLFGPSPFELAVEIAVALTALAALVGIPIAIVLVARHASPPVAAAPQPAAPSPRTPRDAVAQALGAYRAAPGLAALMELRAALFAAAGCGGGATLRDALAATGEGALRAALIAAEGAAFGPAQTRDAAAREMTGATETWLR